MTGRGLEKWRVGCGLTRAELARALQMTEAAIWMLEHDKNLMSKNRQRHLQTLAAAWDLPEPPVRDVPPFPRRRPKPR
jgi:transcriptional regulator with XRE-family HTH domain